MCKRASEGKRCEYADMITNVRKKARYKYRNEDDYSLESKVQKEVWDWQAANPKLVQEHLPEKMPFNVEPGQKPVPKSLLKLLTRGGPRTTVTGLSESERLEHTAAMAKEFEDWEEAMESEEHYAVHNYAGHGFEYVNAYLRKKGLPARAKEYRQPLDVFKETCRKRVEVLDSAFTKVPAPDEPRKVYRFFRVPSGITPEEFMEKYLQEGGGFQEKGYMSTTADPEFIMAHISDRLGKKKMDKKANDAYVIMEILTKKGHSIQPREESRAGDVQSLEKEILIQRNAKFRIVGQRKEQKFEFASNRKDLSDHYDKNMSRYYGGTNYHLDGKFKEGEKMYFPLVQVIDEQLINETNE